MQTIPENIFLNQNLEFTKKEKDYFRKREQVYNHINAKRTLRDEINLIIQKKSELPSSLRKFVLEELNKD